MTSIVILLLKDFVFRFLMHQSEASASLTTDISQILRSHTLQTVWENCQTKWAERSLGPLISICFQNLYGSYKY